MAACANITVVAGSVLSLYLILGDALVRHARHTDGLDPVKAGVFDDYMDLVESGMGLSPFDYGPMNTAFSSVMWPVRLTIANVLAGDVRILVELIQRFDAGAWADAARTVGAPPSSDFARMLQTSHMLGHHMKRAQGLLTELASRLDGAASILVVGREAPGFDSGPTPALVLVVDGREVSRGLVEELNTVLEHHKKNPEVLPGRRLLGVRLLARS